jgi:Na+-transporting methylmalonyl-CoA/oxaloacetate decarboxylase gamma subunit
MSMSALWPHGDPRDVARAVLADHRFRAVPDAPAGKSWWDYLLDALRPWWHRLFDPLGRAIGNDVVTRAIGIGVLVLVLAFLVFVIARFARRLRVRRTVREPAAIAALEAEADARSLLARALAAAAAGRHHEAAALLWSSALRALDERGRVRFDAARTPGEWRRAVRDPAFDALARDAVVALFGDRGADASLVTRMRESYDRVVAHA